LDDGSSSIHLKQSRHLFTSVNVEWPRVRLTDHDLHWVCDCVCKDAASAPGSSLERLALVRERAARIREIRRELEAVNVMDAERRGDQPR
jgi:hypothetical protein